MGSRLAAVAALLLFAGCAHRAPGAPAPPPPRVAEFTPLPETHELHGANPHAYQGKPLCQRCHRPGEAGLVDEPIALCARCHDPGNMKHPFGVAQKSPPADLPFDAGGRIVCHTCHDPHDVKAHKAGLRLEYGALCTRCHVRHGPKAAH